VLDVPPSGIRKFFDVLASMPDVISLGVGEPDFDTPAHIGEAGVAAIRGGFTRYTPVEGTAELKDAIVAKFRRDNALEYSRSQILVSSGAKQTIYNMVMAVVNPGEEVVIPAPYWVSYPDIVLLADGLPVLPYCGPEHGYKITPAQLEAAITPRTRLFVLNSPNNPTGAAYTRPELVALGEVLLRHPRVLVCTDDMYEHIYWGSEPFCSLLTAVPALYDRTVTVNGVSKSYAMTGWRIGYCGGPPEIVEAMATIQSQSTTNPSSIAQKAATAALVGDQTCVAEMNRQFRARHDFFNAGLNRLPGFRALPAAGTFYAWCDVAEAIGRLGLSDDDAFAEYLLEQAGVAGVAGSGFGGPGHIRFSFATSPEVLAEALARMGRALG
jgi:aspartate aminotransferase